MKKIAVLGCGLVGGLIARDLATDTELEVIAVDRSEEALAAFRDVARLTTRVGDLSNREGVARAIADADAVVGAVPGRFGFAMLEAVIEARKPVADISFSPEDPFDLDALAKDNGVTAVVDCGVSPGLSNLAVGRAAAKLDEVDDAVIYVGGLPRVRHWPYEYRIVFSATDVIEEYTRPARMIEQGRVVTREALSGVELVDLPHVGTLEAFNTDGLRTLLRTVPAKSMREKTLRYPGHADRMRMLRDTGFFAETPIDVGGASVVPRELTEKLLFESWKRPADEEELTVLRVTVQGRRDGEKKTIVFDLFDHTDLATGATSMARTTGFPCAITARLLARGEIHEPGIQPLELIGRSDETYTKIVDGLERRGVRFRES